jgi:hypothetical protein
VVLHWAQTGAPGEPNGTGQWKRLLFVSGARTWLHRRPLASGKARNDRQQVPTRSTFPNDHKRPYPTTCPHLLAYLDALDGQMPLSTM